MPDGWNVESLGRAARFDIAEYTPSSSFGTRHIAPPHIVDPGDLVFREPGAGRVNGEDDRVLVKQVKALPFRHVCALRMIARDERTTLYGTGWLLGPRAVVTAGHCLFVRPASSSNKAVPAACEGPVRSVTVIPALAGSDEPFRHAVSDDFEVAPEWRDGGDPDADYGVVFLKDDLFAELGWFGFGVARDDLLPGLPMNLSGYPVDRDDATRQYYAGRRVKAVRGARVLYETDTYGGQSGSPIWVSLNGKPIVIALHTRAYHHLQMNSGVLFTNQGFERLQQWKNRR